MKRPTGTPRLRLASLVTAKNSVGEKRSTTEETLAARAEQRFHGIVTRLEECRTSLVGSGNRETAQLLSVAILQLRMEFKGIADAELKALCDAMIPAAAPATERLNPKPPSGQHRRPAALLKLVE